VVELYEPVKREGGREKISVHTACWSLCESKQSRWTHPNNGTPMRRTPQEANLGAGTIRLHSSRPERSRCQRWKKTLSARRGTLMELECDVWVRVSRMAVHDPGLPAHVYDGDSRSMANTMRVCIPQSRNARSEPALQRAESWQPCPGIFG
jgi:hypothetical protein